MRTQAILFTDRQQVTLADATVPDPGPGELIVETAFSCISPGKELTFLLPRDMQPRDVRTMFDLMLRGRLIVDDLIESVCPVDAPAVYAALRGARSELITAAFDWTGGAMP